MLYCNTHNEFTLFIKKNKAYDNSYCRSRKYKKQMLHYIYLKCESCPALVDPALCLIKVCDTCCCILVTKMGQIDNKNELNFMYIIYVDTQNLTETEGIEEGREGEKLSKKRLRERGKEWKS